jgi:hypothetical protein
MIQVGSLVYAANGQNKEARLNELDPEQEIRRIRIQLELSLISSAAAFNTVAADHAALYAATVLRVKGSWNFDDSALNLTPAELRAWSMDSQGLDPAIEDLRVGDSIPISSGAATKKKLAIDIDFVHQGLDTPNMFCMSSDQFNASAAKLLLDFGALAAGGGNVVLGGGTAVVTVTDVKILAEYGDAYGVFVGPHWTMAQKGEGKDKDADLSPGIELFLAQESDPATFEGVFSQVTMNVDERFRTRAVPPTTIALDYLRTSTKHGSRFFDVTRNGVGFQCSPLRWVKSHIRSAEYELPFHNAHRKFEFTRVPGVAAAYLFLQIKTNHISYKVEEIARRLMVANGVAGSPASLKVRGFGGSENNAFSQFKGRWITVRE